MGLEDLTKNIDLGNLGEKAKGLVENIPDNIKETASSTIDGLTEKLPDNIEEQAKGAVDGVKDFLGL